MCACVSCLALGHVFMQSPFFHVPKMLQLVHDHDELRWRWTKASLTQQTKTKPPGFGEVGAFRAACGRRGGTLSPRLPATGGTRAALCFGCFANELGLLGVMCKSFWDRQIYRRSFIGHRWNLEQRSWRDNKIMIWLIENISNGPPAQKIFFFMLLLISLIISNACCTLGVLFSPLSVSKALYPMTYLTDEEYNIITPGSVYNRLQPLKPECFGNILAAL